MRSRSRQRREIEKLLTQIYEKLLTPAKRISFDEPALDGGISILYNPREHIALESFDDDTIYLHFHPFQYEAWKSDKRIIALIAGTGGGKTSFGTWWTIREILRHPGGVAMIVTPTYHMLEKVVVPGFFRVVKLLGIAGTYRKLDQTFQFAGRSVYFYSAQRPERLEGVHASCIWLDEAGQMPEEVWHVVNRRAGVERARILITTTPYHFQTWLADFYHAWQRGEEPETDIFVFNSLANPRYPREEYERAKRLLPDWKFRMYYEGQFTKPEGMVFHAFDNCHIVDDIPEPSRVIAGVDFGLANPTAILTIYQAGSVFYLVHEYQMSGLTLRDHVKKWLSSLQAAQIKFPSLIFTDPASLQLLVEFRNALAEVCRLFSKPVPLVLPGDNAVEAGIERINTLFVEKRLFVYRRLMIFLKQMQNYIYVKGKPRKEDDHLLDAMRYALYTYTTCKVAVY